MAKRKTKKKQPRFFEKKTTDFAAENATLLCRKRTPLCRKRHPSLQKTATRP